MTTNQTVLDLSKVQHGTFGWFNQYGMERAKKPKATYLGCTIEVSKVTKENEHKLDRWIPVVHFQLTANHQISYTGDKAKAMWKAWRERIFNK